MVIKLKVLKNGTGVIATIGKGAAKRAAVGKYGFEALCNLNQALAQENVSLQKEIKALKLRCTLIANR